MVPCLEFLEDSQAANTWNVVVVDLMLMLFIFYFLFFIVQLMSPILSNLIHVS